MTTAVTPIRPDLVQPDQHEGGRRYTAAETCALTGITYRQLDYACRAGRLIDNAHGYGSVRTFTETEVHLAAAAAQLTAAGFTSPQAWRIAHALNETGTWHADLGCCAITVIAHRANPTEQEPRP